ncbi:phage regulatory protein/antirepressor Ant [Turicibacter sanguinis]|uniref:phage regulatory protein/antirepressor Ant n=1 Tax=Turicibacter sanguinis TaxID=154288 RepID=UPI00241D414F|nr:phage regulatory protein/antirepressor Ant [Turicibacter sanguinis]
MSSINITHFHSRGYEQTEVKTISSREVATMMEVKEHKVMLRKIDNLNEILIGANLCSLDFWVESTYKDTRGREQREYQVTKKGCELIAHKTEGEKGVIFTVRYMERFEQMEQAIQERNEKASLLLAIYEGGQLGVSASKRLVEIETKELSQQVQVMTPKAESYDQFIDADGTYSTTNACKMLGLKRAEVFQWLRDKGLVYKKKTEATQKAVDKGYFKHVIKGGHSTMVITPKGIEFLRDTFLKQAS